MNLKAVLHISVSMILVAFFAGCAMDDRNGLVKDTSAVNPANYPNKPGTVFGVWRSASQFSSNELSESLVMYLNGDSIAFEKVCDWGTHSIKVGTESAVRVTQNALQVQSSNQESSSLTRDGVVYNCRVELERGEYSYQLNTDRLSVEFTDFGRTFIRQ